MKTRTMYLLSRDGRPVTVWYNRKRQPVEYRTVAELPSALHPFRSLRTIRKHVRIASALPKTLRMGYSYGYLIVRVPA